MRPLGHHHSRSAELSGCHGWAKSDIESRCPKSSCCVLTVGAALCFAGAVFYSGVLSVPGYPRRAGHGAQRPLSSQRSRRSLSPRAPGVRSALQSHLWRLLGTGGRGRPGAGSARSCLPPGGAAAGSGIGVGAAPSWGSARCARPPSPSLLLSLPPLLPPSPPLGGGAAGLPRSSSHGARPAGGTALPPCRQPLRGSRGGQVGAAP